MICAWCSRLLRRISKHAADCAGFILIEACIALAIIGLVLGLGIPTVTAVMRHMAYTRTQQNQEKICYAIASYVAQHNVLPRPADPSVPPRHASYGCAVSENDTRTRGKVPFQTLGIPEAWTKDGHHRPMSYCVQPLLTRLHPVHEATSTTPSPLPPSPSQAFNMWFDGHRRAYRLFDHVSPALNDDESGLLRKPWRPLHVHTRTHTVTGDSANFIAFVLISHGASQQGHSGSATARNLTESYDFYAHAEDASFHDQVLWVMRSILLTYYGRTTARLRS